MPATVKDMSKKKKAKNKARPGHKQVKKYVPQTCVDTSQISVNEKHGRYTYRAKIQRARVYLELCDKNMNVSYIDHKRPDTFPWRNPESEHSEDPESFHLPTGNDRYRQAGSL